MQRGSPQFSHRSVFHRKFTVDEHQRFLADVPMLHFSSQDVDGGRLGCTRFPKHCTRAFGALQTPLTRETAGKPNFGRQLVIYSSSFRALLSVLVCFLGDQ